MAAYNTDYTYADFQASRKNLNDAMRRSGISAEQYGALTSQYAQKPYYANQGTDYMYNGNYRSANDLENFAINLHNVGEAAMNWQAELAGALGGEQAKKDWTFDASKFNLGDWSGQQGLENWNQIKNFVVSLPGQMVGGLMQAPGQLIGESLIGDPYTEYKKDERGNAVKDDNGNYLIPDYTLDAGQRLGQAVNAGINVAGVFTGGGSRVASSLVKSAVTKPLTRQFTGQVLKEGGEALTRKEAKQFAKGLANEVSRAKGKERSQVIDRWVGSGLIEEKEAEKALKYSEKLAKWENRNKGMIGRIYEASTGKDIDALGRFGQAGFDALQEASEEFVQQYAEQGARYKQDVSVGDALSAAAWGAFGGGFSSIVGAGIGGRKASYTNKNDQNSSAMFTYSDADLLEIADNPGTHRTADVQAALNELIRRGTRISGSGNGINTGWSKEYRPHEGGVGIINIQRIYMSDAKSADIIKKDFGLTTEEAEDIFSFDIGNQQEVTLAAEKLQAKLNSRNGRLRIAIGRSPATKNGGAFIWLTKILDGDNVQLNPLTYALYGSDIDGDKSFIYFDSERFPGLGFATEFFAEPELHYDDKGRLTGTSNVDFWYSSIYHAALSTPEDIKNFRGKITSVLAPFKKKIDGKDVGEYFADKFLEAVRIDPKEDGDMRNFKIAQVLAELQRETNSMIVEAKEAAADPNSQVDPNSIVDLDAIAGMNIDNGLDVSGSILQNFGNTPEELIRNIEEARKEHVVNNVRNAWRGPGSIDDVVEEIVSSNSKLRDVVNSLQSRGKIEGVNAIAQVYNNLGLIYCILVNSGNPVYRQYAQMYYPFGKEISGKYFSEIQGELNLIPEEHLVPLLETFLRASFGMTSMGVDPTVAINGILGNLIISEVQKSGVINLDDSSITSQADLEKLYDAFYEAYTKYVPIQNSAIQDATTNGQEPGYETIPWKPVERNSEEFYDKFLDIMGDLPMRNLFDPMRLTSNKSKTNFADMTLRQFVQEYATNQNKFVDIGMNFDDAEAFNELFRALAKRHVDGIAKIRNSVLKTMEDIDVGDALDIHSQTGSFGKQTYPVYRAIEAMIMVIDPEIAWRSGFLDPQTLAKTKLGQRLFTRGISKEERTNILCSISLYTVFRKAYQTLKQLSPEEISNFEDTIEKNGTFSDKSLNELARELMYLRGISKLHEVIVAQFIHGNFTMFEALTSTDRKLEDKDNLITQYIKPLDSNADFIVNSLMSKNSEFATGEVSTRLRKAKSYVRDANQRINENVQQELQNIGENSTEQQFNGFITRATNSARIRFNSESLVAQAWEAVIFAHSAVEKGTIQAAASNKYSALQVVYNGAPTSYQEELFYETFGIVTLEHARSNIKLILDCMHDPSKVITVRDPKTGREGYMCLATLMRDSGVNIGTVTDFTKFVPNKQMWIEFLSANPNIATYLGGRSTSYTIESAKMSYTSGLLDSYNAYNGARVGRTDDGTGLKSIEDQQIQDGLDATEAWLVNNPKYIAYLYACIAKEVESLSDFNVAAIRKIILKTHRQAIRAFYVRAHESQHSSSAEESALELIEKAKDTLTKHLDYSIKKARAALSANSRISMDTNNYLKMVVHDFQRRILGTIDANIETLVKGQTGQDASIQIDEKFIKKLASDVFAVEKVEVLDSIGRIQDIRGRLFDRAYNRLDERFPEQNKFVDYDANDYADYVYETLDEQGIDTTNLDRNMVVKIFEDNIASANQQTSAKRPEDIDYLINDTDTEADIIKKLINLYAIIGKKVPNSQMAKEAKSALKDRDAFNELWSKRIFDHDLDILSAYTGDSSNKNAYDLFTTIQELDEEAFTVGAETRTSLVDHLQSRDMLYDRSEKDVKAEVGNYEMPTPNVASELGQIMISNARVMDDAAGTNIQVSLNGSQLKLSHGLGFLPQYSSTEPRPRSMAVSYLENLARKDKDVLLQYVVVSGNFDPNDRTKYKVDTVDAFLHSNEYAALRESGEPVLYFDPLYNPHGLSQHSLPYFIDKYGYKGGYSGKGKGRPWHRITHIINKIHVTAMEAMVMKAKKVFGNGKYVVNERSVVKTDLGEGSVITLGNIQNRNPYNQYDQNLSPAGISENIVNGEETSQIAMQMLLADMRSKYADIFIGEFKNSLKSCGWGKPQAQMLACFFTPGLKITVRFADGSVEEKVFDANYIYGDPKVFTNQYNSLTTKTIVQQDANGKDVETNISGEIIAVDQFTVSPTDLGFKILRGLSEDKEANPNAAIKRTAQTAENALDWSDYEFGNLNMSEVLNYVTPAGATMHHGIKLSDSQTAPQVVLDAATEGHYGATKGKTNSMSKPTHFNRAENSQDHRIQSDAIALAQMLQPSKKGKIKRYGVPGIVRVFGTPVKIPSRTGEISQKEYDRLVQSTSSESHIFDEDAAEKHFYDPKVRSNSAAVVFSRDANVITAAIEYGIRSGNDVLIPVDKQDGVLKRISSTLSDNHYKHTSDMLDTVVLHIDGEDQEFTRVKLEYDVDEAIQSASMAKSYRYSRNPKHICRFLVDFDFTFGTGDAQIRTTPWGGGNIGVNYGSYAKFSLSHLFSSSGIDQTHVISPDEASTLLSSEDGFNGKTTIDINDYKNLFDDNLYQGSDPSIQEKNQAISEYLKQVASGDLQDNGVISYGAGSLKCIAMLYNGQKYMPVFAPKSSMRRFDSWNVYIHGDTLYIPWAGHTTLNQAYEYGSDFSAVHLKLSAYDEIAFKGIATMMRETENGVTYVSMRSGVVPSGSIETKDTIDFIVSADTYGSRSAGRDLQIMKRNLAEANLEFTGSFVYNADGTYKQYIQEKIESGEIDVKLLESLLTNGKQGIEALLSGDLIIHPDPEVMALIKKAVRNSMRNNAPVATIISRIHRRYTGKKDENGNDAYIVMYDNDWFDVHTTFNGFDEKKLLQFYHGLGAFIKKDDGTMMYLTPDDHKPESENIYTYDSEGNITGTSCLFDVYGNTYEELSLTDENGEYLPPKRGHYLVLWGEPRITGEVSDMSLPGNSASIAIQQDITSGLDQGYTPQQVIDPRNIETTSMYEYNDILLQNNAYAADLFRERAEERRAKGEMDWSFVKDSNIELDPGTSWYEYERSTRIARENSRAFTAPRQILFNGEPINPSSEEWKNSVLPRINDFKEALEWDNDFMTFAFLDMFARGQHGSTVDANSKYNDVTLDDWCSAVDDLIKTINDAKNSNSTTPLIIRVYENGHNADNRFAIPYLTNYQIDMLLSHSKYFRRAYSDENGNIDRKRFVDAMLKEGQQALDAIDKNMPVDRAKSIRLFELIEWLHKELDIPFDNSKYIYGGVYTEDYMVAAERAIRCMNILGEISDSDVAELMQKMEDNEQYIIEVRNNLNKRHKDTTVSSSSPSGKTTAMYYDVNFIENTYLDRATQWVQFLAMLDPFMPVANITDRGVHQSWRRRLIKMAKKGKWTGKVFSPYHFKDVSHALSEDEITTIINDKEFMELFMAIRNAEMHGKLGEFLAEATQQGENMLQWLREQKKGGKWAKVVNAGFAFGTGGKYGLKQQAKIFLDTWVQILEENPVLTRRWLEKGKNGYSLLQTKAVGDGLAARWLLECLGGYGKTDCLQETLDAMQQSRSGDLAQRNTFADILQEKVGRHGAGNLALVTLVTKFPQYSFNILHRMANWVFPASSAYYLFTEYMANNTELGQRLHLERDHLHKSLMQAFQVDMLHMGASLMAIILMAGMLQPPEDDRYLCNIEEWMLFGGAIRIRDVWWVQDILGMALPVAIFGKSCLMGKPQFSVIFDGINDACASNPFLRVGDALELFFNPEGNFIEQYYRDKEDYKDAPGGGPENIFDYISANAMSGAARIFGQFVTPSFVREIAQLGDYEHSYKYVYKTNKYGSTTDDTSVERTTYQDAMMRKYLRNNPWLATIADAVWHPSTGYREDEMPYTIYYDQYQLESMQANEEIAASDPMAIITTLQKYQYDMDELQATGFYLSSEAKAKVSEQIWDLYYGWREEWNRFAANEGADYTSLGNGSFAYGKELFYEYKEICEENQRYWKQFYYDTIKNSYLSEPIQMYYRYKTDYDVDATGQVYATGFRKDNGILPFQTAPGNLIDPQGTAGYENSFDSVSAVTGLPLTGNRALVPIDQDYTEWPEFEEWSEGQTGDNYSKSYNEQNGSSKKSTSSGSSGGSSGGSGGYGGGYSRSSGGSSGGGYSSSRSVINNSPGSHITPHGSYTEPSPTRISSMTPNVYPTSPSRIMQTSRPQQAGDVAYLRPNFETKGSREANKRGDI